MLMVLVGGGASENQAEWKDENEKEERKNRGKLLINFLAKELIKPLLVMVS